jgi:hypothetical protein
MKMYHRIGMFIFFASLMLLCQLTSNAQIKKQFAIIVNVAPEVEGKGKATIEITKNGKEKSTVVIPINEKYELNLDYFNEYVLMFKYQDHVDKTLLVSTNVPNEIWQKNANFPPFPMIVHLAKKTGEKIKSEKEKPIFRIAYDKEIDNFGPVLPKEK